MILVSNPGGAAAAAPDSFPTPSSVSDSWNHESALHTAFEDPSLWLMARATFTRKTRPNSSEPSMLYKASAASFSNSNVTKANPRFASFVWPAKSLGIFTSLTSPNGTNAACKVSSVASSERPPTYRTRLSCWGGMVLLV